MSDNRQKILCEVGDAVFGADWQRPMAVALGPYHPDGPRPKIDDRLVRRWVAQERNIPDWVGPALRDLLKKKRSILENIDMEPF